LNQPFFENKKVVLLGGKEDVAGCAKNHGLALQIGLVINLVGELSLAQSAAVRKCCRADCTNYERYGFDAHRCSPQKADSEHLGQYDSRLWDVPILW
jgi:hypothetical protein